MRAIAVLKAHFTMTRVKLPDGNVKEFDGSVTIKAVAKSIGSRLAKDALWGEIDQQPFPVDYEIPADSEVELKIITKKDPLPDADDRDGESGKLEKYFSEAPGEGG